MAADLRSTGALLDLVGEIYDCAIDPDRWPGTLERIARLIDGKHAAIAVNRFAKPDFALQAKWNVPAAYEQTMHEHMARNPFISAAWYATIDEPLSAFGFVGAEELKRSRWFQDTHVPHGQGDVALLLLARSVDQFGSLSVHRESWQPEYHAQELEVLRTLAPHIRRSVMIADMLGARALERDMLATTLDRLAVGIVLTDESGAIVHANEAARQHFADGEILRSIANNLAATDPASARDLIQAIADAASGTTIDIPRSGIVVSLRGRHGRDLAAWVLPLDSGLRRDFGVGFAARVAVFVRELGDSAPFPAELFVRRYAITPAECRVMMLLVQGLTVSEAADTLGISVPTAKTHLARLFEKTGTSRQADLVRLAMSALAPASRP